LLPSSGEVFLPSPKLKASASSKPVVGFFLISDPTVLRTGFFFKPGYCFFHQWYRIHNLNYLNKDHIFPPPPPLTSTINNTW
jgi:hypothetical protein